VSHRWPNGRFSPVPPPSVPEGQGWKRVCGRDGCIHDLRTEGGEAVEIVISWPPPEKFRGGLLAVCAERDAERLGVSVPEVLARWAKEAEAERLGTS